MQAMATTLKASKKFLDHISTLQQMTANTSQLRKWWDYVLLVFKMPIA